MVKPHSINGSKHQADMARLQDGGSEPSLPLRVADTAIGCDVYIDGVLVGDYDYIPSPKTLAEDLRRAGKNEDSEIRLDCRHRNQNVSWDMHYLWDSANRVLRQRNR